MEFSRGYPLSATFPIGSSRPARPFTPAGDGEPPLVQVTGTGEAQVTPDTARVSLGFSTRAPQAAAAYEQTAAALNQVVRALLEAGLAPEQMQTQEIALNPVYETPAEGRRSELVGFEGSATLGVTLHNLSQVGAIIDLAVAAGANRVLGVQFEVRDRGAAEATALALAVQDAQKQAAVLAQSLGIGLGAVWQVEAQPGPGPVAPFLARAGAEGMPVLPGLVTVSRSVRVAYLIASSGHR